MDRELELWNEYYKKENMRHLFIEIGYFSAEYLNLWMRADNDDILDAMYKDWQGAAMSNPITKEFFRTIKQQCPETIFHGTDVGHQYHLTGMRFLQYLKDNGLEESEQYILAEKAIEQGKYYYVHNDERYRENKMAENFIREFDKLNGKSVMGIYGDVHVKLGTIDYINGTVATMGEQLKERYGNRVHSESLVPLGKVVDPIRKDTITINGRVYQASYFGRQDLIGFKDYAYREFWRLENAYDDFKTYPKSGNVLPYDNYQMAVSSGQVFVVDHTKTDGSSIREFYIAHEGDMWKNKPVTREFIVRLSNDEKALNDGKIMDDKK